MKLLHLKLIAFWKKLTYKLFAIAAAASIFVGLFAVTPASAAPTTTYKLKVVTFNVLAPCWASPDYYPASSAPLLNRYTRRQTIINYLLSVQDSADIITLQETTQEEFNYFYDALKLKFDGFQANHNPSYWSNWITVNPPWEPNGVAIFVKKAKFTNITFQDFPASDSGNHSALFTGTLKNSGGKIVRAASVHLDSDHSYNREKELNAVIDHWTAGSNYYDIIAGDFNFETDSGNLKEDLVKAGYYDVLDVLGTAEQTHPWDSTYYGADNWGIIDHVTSRNTSPSEGYVVDNNLFELYPNNEEMRINENLRLVGSDHFPVTGSVTF